MFNENISRFASRIFLLTLAAIIVSAASVTGVTPPIEIACIGCKCTCVKGGVSETQCIKSSQACSLLNGAECLVFVGENIGIGTFQNCFREVGPL